MCCTQGSLLIMMAGGGGGGVRLMAMRTIVFFTFTPQGCHDLLLEPYADTILRVLPRHVRARVFGVASNAVWAFTELMQTVPRPIVEKRCGFIMLGSCARLRSTTLPMYVLDVLFCACDASLWVNLGGFYGRVGMMLAAVARIQTNGAAAPPDYQQNAEILHNLCGNAVFR